MRTLIFIFLLSPLLSFAQKTDMFVKLTDSRNQPIKGEGMLKGYERWIVATTLTAGGKNNNQVNFTMAVGGASADLKRALATGEVLLSAQVNVLAPFNPSVPAAQISYTIKMENISVTSCSEAMGCDNVMNTTVTLQAVRVGWTYYQTGKTGAQVVSKKFGWDSSTQSEWSNF